MYLAVDVGGTKTLVAAFGKTGRILKSVKFPTPKDYDDFVQEVQQRIKSLDVDDWQACAVAMPGLIDRKNGVVVAFGNLPWENVPVQADLERVLNCPVMVENDANLAGLSEARHVIKDFKRVLYVTVSTGIGGGIITNGVIDPGLQDAEIGHIMLEYQGRLRRWEDFASGSAIVEKFGKRASEITDDRTWYVVARNLAIGLIDLIATLTPDAIIIGGGVGSHFDKFKDRLLEALKIYENPLLKTPPIIKARRPEEAVIYGCYELLKDRYAKTN